MRTTMHSGRMAHFGHNDRKNTDKETHIDKEKSSQNFYWTWNENEHVTMSFRESEKQFYETYLREYLDAKNQNSIDHGKKERVQTMEQYMTGHKSMARETLYYIGNAKEHPSEQVIKDIIMQQIAWQNETYPNIAILSIAYHVDEEGAPHFHEREVYMAKDRTYGKWSVNGTKCLEDMGIPLPDPNKPEGKYNNRQMTYTKQCREHFQELCRSKGLEIETEPTGKGGLDLMEYKINEKKNVIKELDEEIEKRGSDLTEKGQELDTTTKLLYKARNELTEANNNITRLTNEVEHLRKEKNVLLMTIERLDEGLKKLQSVFRDFISDVNFRTERHKQKLDYGMKQGLRMANTAGKDQVAFDIAEKNVERACEEFYER